MRIKRPDLARLLNATVKVVEARNTIPILSTVRLVANDGTLTATATDLDIEISGSAPADGDLAVCIDAKLLTGIVGKAAGDDIDITLDDRQAVIKCGRSRFTVQVLPVADFPTMDGGEFTAEFYADMAAVFNPIAFAMSDELTRYYLCGIYLEPEAATATNGHKLATQAFKKLADFRPVIVPSKTVGMTPKGESLVRISETRIQFSLDDLVITSKLIDGAYPDWRRVVPSNNEKIVAMDSASLKAAADRVAVVSSERERGLRLDFGSDEIRLSVQGSAEAKDSVPCEWFGESMTICFNVSYLIEVLSGFPPGDVSMAILDGGAPALFTSENAPGRRIVLMPRRI